MEKAAILDALKALDVTVEADFVPWSKSRNFKEGEPVSRRSLNWKVRILYKGKTIIQTDYLAGIAHCPSYKQSLSFRMSNDMKERIAAEIETGFAQRGPEGERGWSDRKRPIKPDACDVIHSAIMDGEAIDHTGFEDWASNFGFDTDSRKAEAMYRACLDIGLKLRNGLGEDLLGRLKELFQDY